jgi:hypothetical protein
MLGRLLHSRVSLRCQRLMSAMFVAMLFTTSPAAHAQDKKAVSVSEGGNVVTLAGSDSLEKELGVDPALLGRLFDNSIKIDGFEVPLPGEHWAVFAHATLKTHNGKGEGYFLGKVHHKELVKALLVMIVRADSSESLDLPSSNTKNASHKSNECVAGSCWSVYGMSTNLWGNNYSQTLNIVEAAAENMAKKGISYPRELVLVHFTRGNGRAGLELTYYFHPGTSNIVSSSPMPSQKDTPEENKLFRVEYKTDYLNGIKAWGQSTWPQINAAFDAGQ